MSVGNRFLLIGVALLSLVSRLVMAEEPLPAAQQDSKPAAASRPAADASQSVEQLVKQLDAADFDTREAACGKLAAVGKPSIAALEKAAATGNLEVSSRATSVLGKLLKSTDAATETAAREALQHLADGASPAAARKAKSILEPKEESTSGPGIVMPGNGFGGFGGQIIINGGQLNIGGGGVMRTLTAKNVNGIKEVNAVEDGKTVKIVEDPARGIKIELTEKQNGKDVTKKYDAKNVEDLKKIPAGYDLYKKYLGNQPGNGGMQFHIQAGMGNLQIPGNGMPVMPILPPAPWQQRGQLMPPNPVAVPPPAAVLAANNRQQIDGMIRSLKTLSSHMERVQKSDAYKNASPESKAELKKQIDGLSRQLDDLHKQLGDK